MNRLQENEAVAHDWFVAFNAHDLDKLLALYTEDAQHFSPKLEVKYPETRGLITGKDALRTWWQDAFFRLPQLHYEPASVTANEERVFMEYLRLVPGEADMRVAEVLEIKRRKIIASRVYHG
jgi:ketosteroid isomerase-like protein